MSLNDMYSRKDPTEVPSYFLSSLASSLGNLATSAGSAIANAGSSLGSMISKVPVVGNVIGGGVNTLGSGLGQLVSGNVGGGLNSLYTGADKLLGGVLPGGQAFGSGYLGNLYGKADRALGGYLPNIGGVGATPAQMSGAALAGYGAPAGTTTGVNSAGQAVSYAPGANPAAAKPGFWAKGGGLDNLANKIQLGMGLYGLTQKTPENTNRQAYSQLIQPGVGGAGGGSPVMVSPQRPSSDPVMKSAPKVAGVDYGGNISGELSSDIKKLNTAVEKLSNPTRPGESRTRRAAEAGGMETPEAPDIDGVYDDSAINDMFASYQTDNTNRPAYYIDALSPYGSNLIQPGVDAFRDQLASNYLANQTPAGTNLQAQLSNIPAQGAVFPNNVQPATTPKPTHEELDQLLHAIETGGHTPILPYQGVKQFLPNP